MAKNDARARFQETRRAVARLHDVQVAIMNECDDWRPPSVAPRHAVADPTAARAIRLVDVIDGRMAALRAEERELVDFIGEALFIVQAVRDGLGGKYADVLEWHYIDCLSWSRISEDYGVSRTTGRRHACIALDWVDSVGVTRILSGDLDVAGNLEFVT